VKLRYLDAWTQQRRHAARRYAEVLSRIPENVLLLPQEPSWSRQVYHLYVVRTRDREALATYLRTKGIVTGLHYPLPVHRQKCYVSWCQAEGTLPMTERVAAEVLSLPMFPGLAPEHQVVVAAEIEDFSRVESR
jgi:dTDP-4-amino-4,6-dideoxygalactose transaminase